MANLSNINGKFVVEQTTGYVGVGTTDPNFLIEAAGTNSEIALNSTSASIYRLRSTSSDSFIITKNGVGDRLVIAGNGDATFVGNVGIGVTPSATQTLTTQITNGLSLFGNNSTPYGFISNNHVWASGTGDTYLVSGYGASYYKQYQGIHTWATAPSGTAGGSLTFTERMSIDSNGILKFPNVAQTRKIQLWGTQDNDYEFYGFGVEGSTLVYSTYTTGDDHVFFAGTSSTTRNELMRIGGDGNVGIGVTSPDRALDVAQTALIQGAGNVNAGTLALGPRASGVGKWSSISGAHYNQSSGSGNGTGSAGIMMIGTYGANGENDVYIGGGLYEVNAATNIRFYTHTTDTSTAGGTQRMHIDSSGTVTITNSSSAVLKLQAGTNSSASLRLINDAHDWDVNCQTNDKFAIYSHTDATERLVILPTSGNVGIGTNSPFGSATNEGLNVDKGGHSSILIGDGVNDGGMIQSSDNSRRIIIGANVYDSPTASWSRFTASGAALVDVYGEGSTPFISLNVDNGTSGYPTSRLFIASNGAFGIGGAANYGAAGEVLTSNGNAAPSWQAAGGGSAWPQEKFAEYTINSTTSNILVATMNSTTWHGNYLSGCLKFTMSTSDYVQVTYVPVSTFLSGSNKWFFKGTEMTSKNNGSNSALLVFTFAGDQGTFGSTCTLKINRNQSVSNYIKVNVLVQAISNPNMFILN